MSITTDTTHEAETRGTGTPFFLCFNLSTLVAMYLYHVNMYMYRGSADGQAGQDMA